MSRETRTTMQFDEFWPWLQRHANCILRAGTPEVALYDDDDLHWAFGQEDDSTLLVQVLRGKRVAGELFLEPEAVSFVELVPGEAEDEHVFELVAENGEERGVPYFFVLVHGLDQDDETAPRRVH